MNLKKKYFVALISFIVVFCACKIDSGMGEALDLEPPVVKVTYPANLAYVHSDVTFTGTCSDNIGVTLLTITDADTGEKYGEIANPPAEWSFKPSTGLAQGNRKILFTVYDEPLNEGINSRTAISLVIDDNSPEGKNIQIETPNKKRVAFVENLQTLKEKTLNNVEDITDVKLGEDNIEIFQNDYFSIVGNFVDDIGIKEVSVNLFTVLADGSEALIISKTFNNNPESDKFIGKNNSIYRPEFKITKEDFPTVNSAPEGQNYETGVHYIHTKCFVSDEHNNSNTIDLGWFVWYPESDLPRVTPLDYYADGRININKDTKMALAFFDDDGIGDYYFILDDIENPTYTSESLKLSTETRNAFISVATEYTYNNFKATNPTFTSPDYYCQKLLVGFMVDIYGVINTFEYPFYVNDGESPILAVESPANNKTPNFNVNGSNVSFTISGYGFDTKKCESLKMAYIPSSVTLTEEELQTLIHNANDNETVNGITVWNLGLTAAGNFKYKFKKTIEFYDLSKSAAEQTTVFKNHYGENMKFGFELIDDDHNAVYSSVTYLPDTTKPTIEIVAPVENRNIDYSRALTFTINATKTTGIPIQRCILSLTGNNAFQKTCIDNGNGEYTVSVSGEELKTIYANGTNTKPVFRVTAYDDIFNNQAASQRTVSLNRLATLQELSSTKPKGTYKTGTEIELKAKFSSAVHFESESKPILSYSVVKNGTVTSTGTANCISESENDTITFKFNVAQNADGILRIDSLSNNIYSAMFPTELATIIIDSNVSNLLTLDNNKITLDGVAPGINSISVYYTDQLENGRSLTDAVRTNGGYSYLREGRTVYAKVEFTEAVSATVPSLTLSWDSVSYTFNLLEKASDNESIIFKYEITGTTKELAKSDSISYVSISSDITDIPGNVLATTFGNTVSNNVVIDLTPPSAPIVKLKQKDDTGIVTNLDGNKTLNKDQYLVVETGTGTAQELAPTFQYQIDGITWYDYIDDTSIELKQNEPTYKIKARQIDLAGNVSSATTMYSVTILGFPNVTGCRITNSDGIKTSNFDDNIEFILSFDNDLPVNAEDITLDFESLETDSTQNVITSGSVKNISNSSETNKKEVVFRYSLKESGSDKANVSIQGIKITSIKFKAGFKDSAENSAPSGNIISGLTTEKKNELYPSRSGIYYDNVTPTYTITPNADGTCSSEEPFKVTITFSEKIYVEPSTIKIERIGETGNETKWSIPPVLTSDEFNKWYDQMNDTNKGYMLITESGTTVDAKDYRTGISVGPYKKITHGLTTNSTNELIPDTSTKYVLDFNLGLIDDTTTVYPTSAGTPVSVANIRTALESVNYHKHEVSSTSSNITGNGTRTINITFPEEIEPGIRWKLTVDANTFRDHCGNKVDTAINHKLYSSGVAEPFIRVERYTHGYGAPEYTDATTAQPITDFLDPTASQTTNTYRNVTEKYKAFSTLTSGDYPKWKNTSAYIKPVDGVRVRIDSQSQNATLKYKLTRDSKANVLSVQHTNNSQEVALTTNANKTLSQISGIVSDSVPDSHIFYLDTVSGETANQEYLYARKDYIYSQANIGESTANSYEGAFRTVITIEMKNYDQLYENVECNTAKGGRPSYSGFPLRDGYSPQYSKNAYRDENITLNSSHHPWTIVSYEILSENCALLMRFAKNSDVGGSNSKTYPRCDFGQGSFIYGYSNYNNNY